MCLWQGAGLFKSYGLRRADGVRYAEHLYRYEEHGGTRVLNPTRVDVAIAPGT